MNEYNKDKLLELIIPFSGQRKSLIEVINSYGGKITQGEFDKEFLDTIVHEGKIKRGRKFMFPIPFLHPFSVRAVYEYGRTGWAMWLQLLQAMIMLGEIEAVNDGEEIIYSIQNKQLENI